MNVNEVTDLTVSVLAFQLIQCFILYTGTGVMNFCALRDVA